MKAKVLWQLSPAEEPGPLGGVTGLGDEQADGVGRDFLVAGIDPNMTPFIFPFNKIQNIFLPNLRLLQNKIIGPTS